MDIVEIFTNHLFNEKVLKNFEDIYDLERLSSRIAFGNINARDLKWISSSLKVVPELKIQLLSLDEPLISALADHFTDLSHITKFD